MKPFTFDAKIIRPEGIGTWCFVNLPVEFSATYGIKGQVRVKGTVNGIQYQSTALPSGDGGHYLVVGGPIRQQAGVQPGDMVQVTVELDDAPRTVELPGDFREALAAAPEAQTTFESYAYSHKKEVVSWITEAKKSETRQRRIQKAIQDLLANKS